MGGWASIPQPSLLQVRVRTSTAGPQVQDRPSTAKAVVCDAVLQPARPQVLDEDVGRALSQISELKGAVEARLAASEERLAAAEHLAKRLKVSESTIASLQAELQAVREMAIQTRQAAFVKPSREQVLVLLRQKADLSGLDLSGLDLSSVSFVNAQLVGTNFENANLSGAVLCGANLRDANLDGAKLTGADFGGAMLDGVVALGEARIFGHVDLPGMSEWCTTDDL